MARTLTEEKPSSRLPAHAAATVLTVRRVHADREGSPDGLLCIRFSPVVVALGLYVVDARQQLDALGKGREVSSMDGTMQLRAVEHGAVVRVRLRHQGQGLDCEVDVRATRWRQDLRWAAAVLGDDDVVLPTVD